MKSLSSLLITSALIAASTTASAALVAGDIALVGFQASGTPDSFSFATLVNVDAGTVLYFTDNGFTTGTGTGAGFRGVSSTDNDGNEGLIKYTVGANGLAAGQVVSSLSTNTANGAWTSSGLIYGTTAGSGSYAPLALANRAAEQITVFTSTNAQPMLSGYTALYNFDTTGAYEAATDTGTGELAPGLVLGTSAVLTNNILTSFQNFNFAAFSGPADRATWLARIGNAANWTFAGTSAVPVATNVADGSFSVGAVPSPGAIALLGLAGLVARRRH